MTLIKKLENKYYKTCLGEKILNCEDGYRLFTITIKDCSKSEGTKLSELLIELYSEEVTMYLFDYEYYSVHDEYFEFQICVDDEMIKEFNKLYKDFKKSAKELLIEEEEKKEETEEEIKAEVVEDQKEVKEEDEKKQKKTELKDTYKIELTVDEIRSIHSMGILTASIEDMDIEDPIMDFEENSKIIDKLIEKLDNTVTNYSQKEDDSNKSLNDEIKEEVKEENKNEGILYNTSTEINKNIAKYKVGQILYNHGDMANVSGWYRIDDIVIDKFGIYYFVEEIGGDRKNAYHECFINDHDNNNGSTRVVTKEAREQIIGAENVKRQIELLNRDNEEEEKKDIANELIDTCEHGIKIEKSIKIYFNRLAKDQRTKVINKFQRCKKDLDINLFYYSTFIDDYSYSLLELQELRSKIVKYLDFINKFKESIIEEVNNYQEQIENFKKSSLTDDEQIGKLKEISYEEKKERQNEFEYTFRSRGFSPGCQPMNGLVKSYKNDLYPFEILIYNRQLSQNEIAEFELEELFSNC